MFQPIIKGILISGEDLFKIIIENMTFLLIKVILMTILLLLLRGFKLKTLRLQG